MMVVALLIIFSLVYILHFVRKIKNEHKEVQNYLNNFKKMYGDDDL